MLYGNIVQRSFTYLIDIKPMKTVDNLEQTDYLSFKLDKELFAVSVYQVLEVLESQKITSVPKTPDYIRGVINFRGEILPVIETRDRFNLAKRSDRDKLVIIVLDLYVNGRKLIIGAIVDGVRDVLGIQESQIKEVPDMGCSYDSDFVKGMVQMEDDFIMILDINSVFSTEELDLLSETTAAVQQEVE